MPFGSHRPGGRPTQAPKVDRRFKAAGSADIWINSAQWVRVRSSNVQAIMYERAQRRLWVEFKGGAQYFYTGVSPQRAKKFFQTGSFGREVWALRRSGYAGYRTSMGKRGRRSYRARR